MTNLAPMVPTTKVNSAPQNRPNRMTFLRGLGLSMIDQDVDADMDAGAHAIGRAELRHPHEHVDAQFLRPGQVDVIEKSDREAGRRPHSAARPRQKSAASRPRSGSRSEFPQADRECEETLTPHALRESRAPRGERPRIADGSCPTRHPTSTDALESPPWKRTSPGVKAGLARFVSW